MSCPSVHGSADRAMARTTTWPSVRACGVCGREQKIKRAAVDGDPDMCQACWKRDPRSWRVCGRCGELKPRQGRDPENGQPICERCYRRARPVGICDECGRSAQLARTGARGSTRLCGACAERQRRPQRVCGRCGRLAAIALLQAANGMGPGIFALRATRGNRAESAAVAVSSRRSSFVDVTANRICAAAAIDRRRLVVASATGCGPACTRPQTHRFARHANPGGWRHA